MKHSDYITHISNEEDLCYLKTTHFPVNMRLFKTSKEYKEIILKQCDYLKKLVLVAKDGYKKPHGMSSANAGLSFNIIAICRNRNTSKEFAEIMINPVVLNQAKDSFVTGKSNCGSLTLAEPIKVKRPAWAFIGWYDENGERHAQNFVRETGLLTILHEIDHNNGILITDRAAENERQS